MSIRFWLLFSLCSYVMPASASTRNPNGSERSLLYWRYLCENLPQTENVQGNTREFSCPSLNWKVRTQYNSQLKEESVREVTENDSH